MDEPQSSLVGRLALVPIFDKRKAAKVRVIGEHDGLVMVEIIGSQRDVNYAGFRRRSFHPSHLTLLAVKQPEK